MDKFFENILWSWGSDTPSEVIWALNNLLGVAKDHGFKTDMMFEEGGYLKEGFKEEYEDGLSNNDVLAIDLSNFFESKLSQYSENEVQEYLTFVEYNYYFNSGMWHDADTDGHRTRAEMFHAWKESKK